MFQAIEKIEEALAVFKQGPGEKNLAAVVAALETVSTLSLDGLRDARRERMLQMPRFVGEEGFAPVATDIWIDAAFCSVLARQSEDGRRAYLVTGYFGENEWRVIGTSATAPDSATIGNCLLSAGLLQTKPLPGREWAINIDGANPFDSNFPAEELRDCAFDELVLDGSLSDSSNQVVCFFEIAADGEQLADNDSYIDADEWVNDRGITFPEDGDAAAAAEQPGRPKP